MAVLAGSEQHLCVPGKAGPLEDKSKMSSNGSGEEEENGRVAGINKGNQQSRLTRSFSASKVFSFRNLLMSIQTNMPAFAAKKGIPAALNFWREREKQKGFRTRRPKTTTETPMLRSSRPYLLQNHIAPSQVVLVLLSEFRDKTRVLQDLGHDVTRVAADAAKVTNVVDRLQQVRVLCVQAALTGKHQVNQSINQSINQERKHESAAQQEQPRWS